MIIPRDVTYEAVVSSNYSEYFMMGNGKMPRFPVFSTLASGTMSGNPSVTTLGNAIAPTGYQNWCYTVLGNQLAALGIPVAFFNAAAGGSSIRKWSGSVSGGGQFCPNNLAGEPYATFKKTLNYYGSLFGFRAVLWHQGESDNTNTTNPHESNVTTSEYKAGLEAVIRQSRIDFGTASAPVAIPWVVSVASFNKVSPPFLNTHAPVTTAQNQVISGNPIPATPLNPLPILGVETDLYGSIYRIDDVHFNNGYDAVQDVGIDGLRQLGTLWKAKLPLSSGSPISPSPLQNLTVTKTGSSFKLDAPPSGYAGYYWVANNDRLDNALYTAVSSITISGSSNYRCYLKKSNGNIELTASAYTTSVCSANREAAVEEETDGVGLKTYPNPSTDDFTIEFNVPFEADFAKVDLTNMNGEVVKVVAQGSFAKGHYSYPMVGKELPSGTYICRLLINDTTYSTKLIKLGN